MDLILGAERADLGSRGGDPSPKDPCGSSRSSILVQL